MLLIILKLSLGIKAVIPLTLLYLISPLFPLLYLRYLVLYGILYQGVVNKFVKISKLYKEEWVMMGSGANTKKSSGLRVFF